MPVLEDAELQTAAAELLIGLRRTEGFSEPRARRLIAALNAAAAAWAGRDCIPRTTANLFVDLASGIEASGFAYGGDEGARIAAYALEVQEAVREVVRPAAAPHPLNTRSKE